MSNVDSFIEEVSEEVRRDRLYHYLRRYGWIAVLVVVGIVGGAAWSEWQKARATAAAEATGNAILTALELQDEAARVAGLEAVAAGPQAGAIVALLTAAEQERLGETEAAAQTLDRVAQDGAVPVLYRNLAALKAVLVRGETLDPAARRAALEPLAVGGAPFRTVALEQIALADLAAGNREAALEGLRALAQDAEASEALRDRAESLIVALGGDVGGSE